MSSNLGKVSQKKNQNPTYLRDTVWLRLRFDFQSSASSEIFENWSKISKLQTPPPIYKNKHVHQCESPLLRPHPPASDQQQQQRAAAEPSSSLCVRRIRSLPIVASFRLWSSFSHIFFYFSFLLPFFSLPFSHPSVNDSNKTRKPMLLFLIILHMKHG